MRCPNNVPIIKVIIKGKEGQSSTTVTSSQIVHSNVSIAGIYANSVVASVRLAVFQLKLRQCRKTTFQVMLKVDGRNEDKTVKSVCDPKD